MEKILIAVKAPRKQLKVKLTYASTINNMLASEKAVSIPVSDLEGISSFSIERSNNKINFIFEDYSKQKGIVAGTVYFYKRGNGGRAETLAQNEIEQIRDFLKTASIEESALIRLFIERVASQLST